MLSSMKQESDSLFYGYGDDFYSIKELLENIKQRKEKGIKDLSGAAIFWKKEDNPDFYNRIGIVVLDDGSISFAHAEDL